MNTPKYSKEPIETAKTMTLGLNKVRSLMDTFSRWAVRAAMVRPSLAASTGAEVLREMLENSEVSTPSIGSHKSALFDRILQIVAYRSEK